MTLFLTLVAFLVIAVALAWYFISHERGQKNPIGSLWAAVGFGLLGAVMAGVLETVFTNPQTIDDAHSLTAVLAVNALGVGLIEEACKFIPLALFLYHKKYFNEHTDGIIYFVLAGLGFGVPENILYTLSFGAHTGLARIILTPFFHAATTGMVGYYLAKSKLAGKSIYNVWPALLAAMLLHGLYDLGLMSAVPVLVVLSLMITVGLSVSLFVFYMRAGELDRAKGLSVVGHNSFCRSCGYPNPKHNLYCTHCGRRA